MGFKNSGDVSVTNDWPPGRLGACQALCAGAGADARTQSASTPPPQARTLRIGEPLGHNSGKEGTQQSSEPRKRTGTKLLPDFHVFPEHYRERLAAEDVSLL